MWVIEHPAFVGMARRWLTLGFLLGTGVGGGIGFFVCLWGV